MTDADLRRRVWLILVLFACFMTGCLVTLVAGLAS